MSSKRSSPQDAGYSHRAGFNASIGANPDWMQMEGLSAGLSYNEQTGFGLNAGYQFDNGIRIGGSISGSRKDSTPYGSLSLGYNHGSGFGTSASYDYRTGSTTVGVSHMMHHSSGYLNQTTTGLNWNSSSGFSTSLSYSFNAGMRDFQELSPYEQAERLKKMETQRNSMAGLMESMGNNWNSVMQGVGYLFGGRDEESLLNDLFGHSDDFKRKQFFENMSPEELRFFSMVGVEPTARGGGSDKNILYDTTDVSDIIKELDSEMELSEVIPSDVLDEGVSLFLKGLSSIFPIYGAFSILSTMYDHKDSPKKMAELVAQKKVTALTREIIEMEAKEVDKSHQEAKTKLEEDIKNLKYQVELFERGRYFENGSIIELDETLRNDTNVSFLISEYEKNKSDLIENQLKLKRVNENNIQTIDNLNLIYNDLSKPIHSRISNDYNILYNLTHYKDQYVALTQFRNDYANYLLHSVPMKNTFGLQTSNASKSWKNYKRIRGSR